jgi:hypothetical protein
MKRFAFGLAAVLLATPACADDGSSQLGAGGIVFVKSADIRMAKEDLYLSPDKAKIRFEFANDSGRDQDVLVAFPLPDVDVATFYGEAIGTVGKDPVNFVGFSTSVDGKPVAFKVEQRALVKGRDVSAALRAAGVPLNLAVVPNGYDLLGKLSRAQKAALAKAGAVAIEDDGSATALWTVQTRFYWTQHFPAGKTVVIEHGYQPVTGMGQYIVNKESAESNQSDWIKPFCIDKGSVAHLAAMGADRRLRPAVDTSLDANVLIGSVTDYILNTANTWKGPIGHFHLTLDKRDPRAVLSLCWKGDLKKTGATTFEFSADNFAPAQDIHLAVFR